MSRANQQPLPNCERGVLDSRNTAAPSVDRSTQGVPANEDDRRVETSNVPADLTELDQWVLWRSEIRQGKQTKVPYQTNECRAKTDDPSTWTTYEDVCKVFRSGGYDGIGFVFLDTDPFFGLDLDDCLDNTGRLKPWAQPLVDRFANTYAEVSPSGTGVKIWGRGTLLKGTRVPFGDGQVEVYGSGRYFTVTGNVFADAPSQIEEHQASLDWLITKLAPARRVHRADLRDGSTIRQGQRHNYLVSATAKLEARGMDQETVLETVRGLNSQRCSPPKPDAEVRQMVDWVFAHPSSIRQDRASGGSEPHDASDLLPYHLNDHGNSRRVIAFAGDDLRYNYDFKSWLVWDGRRWCLDRAERSRTCAKHAMLAFLRQAMDARSADAEKFARASLDSKRITNALREAQSDLAVNTSELDAHPDLLNFDNGTVDLRTGELREHNRQDYITKILKFSFAPTAQCPKFMTTIGQLMGARPEATPGERDRVDHILEYLQRAFGYSLTGHTISKAVFILHGNGDNGKSTLLSTFLELLEEYAVLLQIDSLMVNQESNNVKADIADLRGARFVMTSETEEGQRVAEGKLKRITQGMGKIKTARKYENPIQFDETHKLWIDANHLPEIRGTDNAIWNRLHPIPFNVTIPKSAQDRDLRRKLLDEAEGILAWCVRGSVAWYRDGLEKLEEVAAASDDWRGASDQVARYLNECCETSDRDTVRGGVLYEDYLRWAQACGERVYTQKAFGMRMGLTRFTKEHGERGTYYVGLRILSS